MLVLYSNINRPDAGLYHLPYIQLINENKILLGITNIHSRFGHISILQYLSAIYNNNYFPIESIVLPPAILAGAIFLYFFSSSCFKLCFGPKSGPRGYFGTKNSGIDAEKPRESENMIRNKKTQQI